jgi:hypothetical protein
MDISRQLLTRVDLLQVKIRLKIPGVRNPFATRCWDFVDDTGAGSMNLFASDIEELERAVHGTLQVIGHAIVGTASGNTCMPAYHLQARLIDEATGGSNYLTPWTDIRVYVRPGAASFNDERLSGTWIRHMLYFANPPDNTGNLYLEDSLADFVEGLPDVDVTQARAPRWDDFPPPTLLTTAMDDSDEMDTTQD